MPSLFRKPWPLFVAEDWGGRLVEGERFEGLSFTEDDLSEVVTKGAVFDACTFRGVRFNVSSHERSAFTNCTFVRCGFFDATFTGCKLTGSRFEECTFDLLKVVEGEWSFVGLRRADLRSATFTDVRMREADLGGVRAAKAVLTGLDLSGASLTKADLSGADLRGSDLTAIDPGSTNLRGALITFEQAVTLALAQGLDVRPE